MQDDMWELQTLERRYSVPPSTVSELMGRSNPVEDLHAWSIYRQNLNSGFTDSALGSSEKSSPPYGNFKLREQTVSSILNHPKYGPTRRSTNELGGNMFAYLKFGLPRVFPPTAHSATGVSVTRLGREASSGYDSSDEGLNGHHHYHPNRMGPQRSSRRRRAASSMSMQRNDQFRRSRSDPDFRNHNFRSAVVESANSHRKNGWTSTLGSPGPEATGSDLSGPVSGVHHSYWKDRRRKSKSEANLLATAQFDGYHEPQYPHSPSHYHSHSQLNSSGSQHLHHMHHVSPTHHHEERRYRMYRSARDDRDGARSDFSLMDSGINGAQHYLMKQQDRLEKRSHAGSKAGSHISAMSHTTRSSRTHMGPFQAMANAAPPSAAGSLYAREAQLLNEKFFPKDTFYSTLLSEAGEGTVLKHPHLQVRSLCYEVPRYRKHKRPENRHRLLDNISFEVHGGELMAIMATHDEEGTTLLDILANSNRANRSHCRVRGELVVNGVQVLPVRLEDRLAYVQQDCSFAADMSVRQTLLFTSLLKEPGNPSRGFDTKGRINALIEDLGLSLVKHTRVKHLTMSERRRLNVACHLLLDTDIVLLDQPTKGMDIFDTFFLVEYLRQWAARGRIVILTIHPPTYEIFTMMSKIALLSSGRLMYFGKRREMLPYFAFIEFPCPAYKNPSDYYLDLVTLDNLSAEAMLESSERIKLLADTFRRRQEPMSDPGPPGVPPAKVHGANFLVQILALWIRALIYMFPYNLITLGRHIFLAAFMSVMVGAVYDGVRLGVEQEHVMDRFGFHYVMMAVAVWPIMLLTITEVWSFKDAVTRDLEDKLYSKSAYIISKLTYSFLPAAGVFLAYILPAYTMSGLKPEEDNMTFSVYIGYMLLYLFTLRSLAMAMAYTFNSRHLAAAVTAFIFTCMITCAGYTVHFLDLSVLLFWLKWVSPTRWIMEQIFLWDFLASPVPGASRTAIASRSLGNTLLLRPDFPLVSTSSSSFSPLNSVSVSSTYLFPTSYRGPQFLCSKNPEHPVVQQDSTILRKIPCGFPNGWEALSFMRYEPNWALYVPLLAVFGFWFFWLIWTLLAFAVRKQNVKKSRSRAYKENL